MLTPAPLCRPYMVIFPHTYNLPGGSFQGQTSCGLCPNSCTSHPTRNMPPQQNNAPQNTRGLAIETHTQTNNAHTGRLAQTLLTDQAGNAASEQTPRITFEIVFLMAVVLGFVSICVRLHLKFHIFYHTFRMAGEGEQEGGQSKIIQIESFKT